MERGSPNSKQIDWVSFSASLAIIVLVCLPLVLIPRSGHLLIGVYEFISRELGFLYLMAGSGVLILLGWLAFGRYGQVKLGAEGDEPEFSDYSWAAMLFCGGVGAGLMVWAPVEWGYYFDAPPFGAAPRSDMAATWASTYGIFHWGPTAWAFYCLPTLAIAYPYYVKQQDHLRFSCCCYYYLGERETVAGRLIDMLFMIALLGGAGSSLGFSTPLIAACFSRLTGFPADFSMEVVAVLVCVALFATSAWLGLRKGIKRLSDINVAIAILLLAYVLVAGPTVFLFKASINGMGMLSQNFIRMNTWSAPFMDTNFVESWTVFYWAWWIAYGPFVGLFVTRISKGRTIRHVILGMVGYGSLGGMLFYLILGNYGLSLELQNQVQVTAVLQSSGKAAAVIAILDQLPWASAVIGVVCVVSVVFCATTYDSASYILAACATRRLPADEEPARWHRMFWAFALAMLPLSLMAVGQRMDDPRQALTVIQTATLVVSLPLLLVGVLMAMSLVQQLAKDHGNHSRERSG